jgi:hypothetical protein
MMIADLDDDRKDEDILPELDNPDSSTLAVEEERLHFEDDDEQLPWLESVDDGEEEGPDTSRIIGFALVGLLALVAIVGGIWWASHRSANSHLIADGSTIEAPKEPYKSKPENPGGKTFAGTGDTSFKVGEGKTSEGRLDTGAAARPGIDIEQAGDKAKPATPAASSDQAADTSGIGVQLGAYVTRDQAQAGWNTLAGRHEVLKGRNHRIVEGQADIGTVYRLQVVADDLAGANSLCQSLKAAGAACQVKR